MEFSVPTVGSGRIKLVTPKTIPVTFQGEHVADASCTGFAYSFELFRGHLFFGLTTGTLAPVLIHDDIRADHPQPTERVFTEVRIIESRSQ
jgi:hypothetical protein